MKKIRNILFVIMVGAILALMPQKAQATGIDVLEVGTSVSIGGVDKTKMVVGQTAGLAFTYGVNSITGSSTFNPTNIGTLSAVYVTLDAIVDDARYAIGTTSGQNIVASVYGVGAGTATAISTTATNVHWLAIGTP